MLPLSIGCNSFTANWNLVSGATSYVLDVSTSNAFAIGSFVPGFQDLNVNNVSTYTVSGLSNNTPYFYRVRAVSVCGTSGSSATQNVTTAVPVPTIQAASNVQCGVFTANWAPVAGATTYRLDVASDAAFTTYIAQNVSISPSSTTSYQATGLAAATNYYYRVRSEFGCGTSVSSGTQAISTLSSCTYCSAQSSNKSVYISNVTFSGINNSSLDSYYSDYTSLSATISPVCTNTFSINESASSDYFGFWIDYNRDGIFSSSEFSNGGFNGSGFGTATFVVPTTILFLWKY